MKFVDPCLCSLLCLSLVGTVLGGAGWEYDGSLGPSEWSTNYRHCGGRMQSPINVDVNNVIFDPHLRSFDLRQYSRHSDLSMTLENVNGHTVEVIYGGEPITISGGSLPDEYVLDQFHFHWGASDDIGSEHLMNSKPAPMEMHLVHHMKKLNKTESAQQPFGLSVLAFFFQIGTHNPGFDHLLANFSQVVHTDNQVNIQPFALSDLLPTNASTYYRYFGSLTTPPCYETVIWSVFTQKITISLQQLNVFRTLRNQREGETTEQPISNDFRPVQPLNERTVTSNDPSVLRYVENEVIIQILDDLNELRQSCSVSSNDSGSLRAVTSKVAVMALVTCLLVWVCGVIN